MHERRKRRGFSLFFHSFFLQSRDGKRRRHRAEDLIRCLTDVTKSYLGFFSKEWVYIKALKRNKWKEQESPKAAPGFN